MKSLAMLNFKNLSPIADFSSKLDQLVAQFDILQKNVLYSTHMNDKILKLLKKVMADSALQKQVDDYFEEDEHETSPQTEPEEQNDPNKDSIRNR